MGQQQSEKSVLSRGLKFVPISKRADEFSVKQDLEKFLRRVEMKAFFHDKKDDSNTSNTTPLDTFETLQIRKSKWTPLEGQFASLDFSIKKCRHSINKRKFSPSPHLELRVFTFYLKSTNLTTQVDPSFLPAVVPPNLFTAIQTKSWCLSSKLCHLTLRTGNVRLKFFVTLISLAKTNLFSLQILHLFILSFPMTKVSGPSNIFSINARLGNLALKRYFVEPNQYLHTISFHSAVITTNKPVAQLWVLKRRYIDDCIGATSSTREELTQFITAVNSFHPALKYIWEISDISLLFQTSNLN